MSIIGTNISIIRKQLGFTQEELASMIGYKSKSSINKIELGINDIPQSKIVRFAEVLGTTPEYLMGWDNTKELTTAEKIKHLRAKRNMTLEEVASIAGVGKSTVRKWESGIIENIRKDKIKSLAEALGTTPEYLMGWNHKETTFGQILKELRIRRNMNQSDLASALSVTPGAVGLYETDKRFPDYKTLLKLSEIFGVSTDYLLGKESPTHPDNPTDDELDDELDDYLEALRTRPEMKMLFSVMEGATLDEVQQAVRVIEAMRGKK